MLQDVKDEKCGVFNASWESLTTDSGGGPITAYRAQVQMEHKDWHNCTASSESRSCLFRGLVNKGEYRVRVQAINRKGPSDWFNGSFEADSYTGMLVTVTYNDVKKQAFICSNKFNYVFE